MIPLLGSEIMTRSRYAAASWSHGLPIRPAPTTLAFYASRVPLSRRKQQLPDGIRANETVYLITYTELLTASDGVYADRVTIGSVVYEVIESEARPAFFEPTGALASFGRSRTSGDRATRNPSMSAILTKEEAIRLVRTALVTLFGVADANVIRANTDNARPAGSHFWLRSENIISLGKPQKGRTALTLEVLKEHQFTLEAVGNTAKDLMIRMERLLLRDDIVPVGLTASGISIRRLDDNIDMDSELSSTWEPRSRRTFLRQLCHECG